MLAARSRLAARRSKSPRKYLIASTRLQAPLASVQCAGLSTTSDRPASAPLAPPRHGSVRRYRHRGRRRPSPHRGVARPRRHWAGDDQHAVADIKGWATALPDWNRGMSQSGTSEGCDQNHRHEQAGDCDRQLLHRARLARPRLPCGRCCAMQATRRRPAPPAQKERAVRCRRPSWTRTISTGSGSRKALRRVQAAADPRREAVPPARVRPAATRTTSPTWTKIQRKSASPPSPRRDQPRRLSEQGEQPADGRTSLSAGAQPSNCTATPARRPAAAA